MRKPSHKFKTLCFDIDGTLCTNTEGKYDQAKPYPQNISKLNQLYKTGHQIILHTARGTTTGLNWKRLTQRQLSRWGVKYHSLVFGKPSADLYFDDKSVGLFDWLSSKSLVSLLKKFNPLENELGIMQGRLSHPRDGRIQSFPWGTWREEFSKARSCGLQLIEWIFEADACEKNPIMLKTGIEEIRRLSFATGTRVKSVCADYFMNRPFIRTSAWQRRERIRTLERLILQCSAAGVRYIVIPFVDKSKIVNEQEFRDVAKIMKEIAPLAKSYEIVLCLETNLRPHRFWELLHMIKHPHIQVNYDIGNSASLGFDTARELKTYGDWIATIHVKDRKRGGPTVPLGTGSADFKTIFSRLPTLGYSGPLILQAARNGDEMKTVGRYIRFVKKLMRPWN